MPTTPAEHLDPADLADLAALPAELAQALPPGAALVKAEGRVFVRFSGVVRFEDLRVPWQLVPPQGVLAKPSKWRKMEPLAQQALVLERASVEAIAALHAYVEEFVREIAALADDCDFDAMTFLAPLADLETAEPAEYVFERIRQRIIHAVEREQEEHYAARTKQSINLAEYPQSFEVASRMPRKFIALLGPTNSGKTHRAMEALVKAPSGVYLAPLRLLALENFERMQAVSVHGKPLKVSLVTGEERRLAAGATHVASTVEMLDTRTRVDVAVIDEIQMLSDRDRGAAWTAAVCGNLSPEVRRAQAERFRDGSADIVVGTDALAMGLNMPIARIVMTTAVKYNGIEEEEISAALARQIAGRAGRFGVHEEGFVAGYDDDTHEVMRALLKEKLAAIPASGFAVAPSIEQLHRIAAVTNERSLVKLLRRFVHNIDVPDGFFYPKITDDQSERAIWLDTLDNLTVAQKFMLSLVPVSNKVPSLQSAWEYWCDCLAKKKVCKLDAEGTSLRWLNLQEVEDACRRYSAYAWVAYREPDIFPSVELAQQLSRTASERVDSILQQQNAAARQRGGASPKRRELQGREPQGREPQGRAPRRR